MRNDAKEFCKIVNELEYWQNTGSLIQEQLTYLNTIRLLELHNKQEGNLLYKLLVASMIWMKVSSFILKDATIQC